MRISRKAAIGLLGGGRRDGADRHRRRRRVRGRRTRPTLAAKIDPSRPKNVILLVGDGMGDSEVTLGALLRQGRRGPAQHGPARRSAAARSTTCCGPVPGRTTRRTTSATPRRPRPRGRPASARRTAGSRRARRPPTTCRARNAGYRTYMEIARDRGKATGNVSTAEITDATPAGPSSHISQRACQGPADARTTCPTEAKTAATPGLGSIAEQQVDEGFDVYLGGGRARYQQTLTDGRRGRRRRLRRGQGLPVTSARSRSSRRSTTWATARCSGSSTPAT